MTAKYFKNSAHILENLNDYLGIFTASMMHIITPTKFKLFQFVIHDVNWPDFLAWHDMKTRIITKIRVWVA